MRDVYHVQNFVKSKPKYNDATYKYNYSMALLLRIYSFSDTHWILIIIKLERK